MVGHADVPLTNTYFPDKHLVVHDFMFFFCAIFKFQNNNNKNPFELHAHSIDLRF